VPQVLCTTSTAPPALLQIRRPPAQNLPQTATRHRISSSGRSCCRGQPGSPDFCALREVHARLPGDTTSRPQGNSVLHPSRVRTRRQSHFPQTRIHESRLCAAIAELLESPAERWCLQNRASPACTPPERSFARPLCDTTRPP